MKKNLKKSCLSVILILMVTLLMSVSVMAAVSRPGGVRAGNNTINSVELRWNRVSGASGYAVYRSVNSGKYKRIKTIKGSNNCKYVDKGLKKAKKCSYKIKSYKKTGSKVQYSKYSDAVSVRIRKKINFTERAANCKLEKYAKIIGGMKKVRSSKYPDSYYKGNHVELGNNSKAPAFQPIMSIKNTGNRTFTWNGVRIGDSRSVVERKLKTYGYAYKEGDTYQTWSGGKFTCKFKNGKLAGYEYITYSTSY